MTISGHVPDFLILLTCLSIPLSYALLPQSTFSIFPKSDLSLIFLFPRVDDLSELPKDLLLLFFPSFNLTFLSAGPIHLQLTLLSVTLASRPRDPLLSIALWESNKEEGGVGEGLG